MSHVSILPSNGTRVNVGFIVGQNGSAAENVQKQLDEKGYGVNARNIATGASITLGKDLISIGSKDENKGFQFRAGAEIQAGIMNTKKDVKIGEKDAYVVTVYEEDYHYDSYNDEYYTQTHSYNRTFYSMEEAQWYYLNKNYSYNPNGNTYATYPRHTVVDINDTSSKTEGSVRLGITAGVQKNFDGGNVRVDALTGYDVIQKATYVGGRITVATNNLFEKPVGFFGQVDKEVTGDYKDLRGQIGVSVNF